MALSSMARRFAGRNLLVSTILSPVFGLSLAVNLFAPTALAGTVNLAANAPVVACSGGLDARHWCDKAVAVPESQPWVSGTYNTVGQNYGLSATYDLGAVHKIDEIKVNFLSSQFNSVRPVVAWPFQVTINGSADGSSWYLIESWQTNPTYQGTYGLAGIDDRLNSGGPGSPITARYIQLIVTQGGGQFSEIIGFQVFGN